MSNKPLRVIGYGRVSTEEQAANYSLAAQQARFEQLSESNNWRSLGFQSETGSGTSIFNRPVLCSVLQQIKEGQGDALWVKEIDRLSRPENLGDISHIADLLASSETILIVDTRELDLTEDASVLMLDFEGVLAKHFRRQLLRNMDRGKKRKAELGRKAGGADIFGYCTDSKGRYTVCEEEAGTVKRVFNMAMNDLTIREIVEELARRGIASPSGNSRWSNSVVQGMLRNDVYVGVYCFGKKPQARDVDGSRYKLTTSKPIVVGPIEDPNHPAIVEPWLFSAVQQKLDMRKINKEKRVHLATGILRCPDCDSIMNVKFSSGPKRTNVPKYACIKKPNCSSERLLLETVDGELWNHLAALFMEPERVYSLLDEEGHKSNLEEQLSVLESELAALNQKEQRLLNLYMEDRINLSLFDKKKEELDNKRIALKDDKVKVESRLKTTQQRDLTSSLVNTLRILAKSSTRFTEEQKVKVFRSMVKQATIHESGVEMELYVEPVRNIWWKFRQKATRCSLPQNVAHPGRSGRTRKHLF